MCTFLVVSLVRLPANKTLIVMYSIVIKRNFSTGICFCFASDSFLEICFFPFLPQMRWRHFYHFHTCLLKYEAKMVNLRLNTWKKKLGSEMFGSDLRINLEQVVILGVSSEEISNADDSTAKRPSVLYTTQVLLLPCSHPPCTHRHTQSGIHSQEHTIMKARNIWKNT